VAAYEELVRRHERVAVRVAFTVGQPWVDAEAAAQEAFVKAYRALPRFRPGAAFRPWLLAIVANEARNQRRTALRSRAAAGRLAVASTPAATVASAEATFLGAEERSLLLRAVNRLAERDRLVLACRYFLELSERETAAVLGVPRGTVKSRSARALNRLRDQLQTVQERSTAHG
jgi:RNA polymerase sigma-70 factor (ECF subfamily)